MKKPLTKKQIKKVLKQWDREDHAQENPLNFLPAGHYLDKHTKRTRFAVEGEDLREVVTAVDTVGAINEARIDAAKSIYKHFKLKGLKDIHTFFD